MKYGKYFWGPPIWRLLHKLAASYEPHMYKSYRNIINSLVILLPCPECRSHMTVNLQALPVDRWLENKHTLSRWTYLFHDLTNRQSDNSSYIPFLWAFGFGRPRSPSWPVVRRHYMKSRLSWADIFPALHVLALGYEQYMAEAFTALIESIAYMLHADDVLGKYPLGPYLKDRDGLFLWTLKTRALIQDQKKSPSFKCLRGYYYEGMLL